MSLIPRPRWPEEPNPPFDFQEWDQEKFRRAGEVFTRLAQRREGEDKMRDMLLRLYFNDGNL
jgi:hypothetical protein